jgi:hypothetical protein
LGALHLNLPVLRLQFLTLSSDSAQVSWRFCNSVHNIVDPP